MISQALLFRNLHILWQDNHLQAHCLVTEFNLLKNTFEFLGEKYYYCQNSDTPPAIPSDSFVSSWGVLCPCCVDVVCSDPQAMFILWHYIAIIVFNLHENPPHCKQGLFL